MNIHHPQYKNVDPKKKKWNVKKWNENKIELCVYGQNGQRQTNKKKIIDWYSIFFWFFLRWFITTTNKNQLVLVFFEDFNKIYLFFSFVGSIVDDRVLFFCWLDSRKSFCFFPIIDDWFIYYDSNTQNIYS